MKLVDYLAEKKLKQSELAGRVGVTQQAVSMWISHGHVPRKSTLRRILEITGGRVTPNDFYEKEPREAAE